MMNQENILRQKRLVEKNIDVILYKYRRNKKITQISMGKLIGVSQSQISKWENKKHVPSNLRLKDIKIKLKVNNV